MSDKLPITSSDADVAAFLQKVAAAPKPAGAAKGRLIFALDATASRQPTWDRACHIQGEMFQEAATLGGLALQLVWYRGLGEFEALPWLTNGEELTRRMNRVGCAGGLTQIERVLAHALAETRQQRIGALVFVGDCMEEESGSLYELAGQLGLLGVPVFVFHEGGEPVAGRVLRRISELSHGAYCPFDAGSAQQLRELLRAVAVYAAGGRPALEDFSRRQGGLVLQLTHQLGR